MRSSAEQDLIIGIESNIERSSWKEAPFKTQRNIRHWLYCFGYKFLALDSQIKGRKIFYNGSLVASFVLDEELKMPIFQFDSLYEYVRRNQEIYLRHLQSEE